MIGHPKTLEEAHTMLQIIDLRERQVNDFVDSAMYQVYVLKEIFDQARLYDTELDTCHYEGLYAMCANIRSVLNDAHNVLANMGFDPKPEELEALKPKTKEASGAPDQDPPEA